MSGSSPISNRVPVFVTPQLLERFHKESKSTPSVEARQLIDKLFILNIKHPYIEQNPESVRVCLKIVRHLQKHEQIQGMEIDTIVKTIQPVLDKANLPNQFHLCDKEGVDVPVNSTLFKLACPKFFSDKPKGFKEYKSPKCSKKILELFKTYLETRCISGKNLTGRDLVEACQLGHELSHRPFEDFFLGSLMENAKTISTESALEEFIENLKIYTNCSEQFLNQLEFIALQSILKAKGCSFFSLPLEGDFLCADMSVFLYLDCPLLNSLIKKYVKGVIVSKSEEIESLLCLPYLPKEKQMDLKAISFKVGVEFEILNAVQETFPTLQYLDVKPLVVNNRLDFLSYKEDVTKKLKQNSSLQFLCFLNGTNEKIEVTYHTEDLKARLFPYPVLFLNEKGIRPLHVSLEKSVSGYYINTTFSEPVFKEYKTSDLINFSVQYNYIDLVRK